MKISREALVKGTQDILVYLGESKNNAELIAGNLVEADMMGVSTHGTYLLEVIKMRAEGGQLALPTTPEFLSDDGASALIDGKDGIGIVAAHLALDTAIKKAKEYGIGFVLVRNANNVGALGVYTRKAAEQGVIATMIGNAAPAAAPFGASEAYIGTSPISIGIPIKETGFCLDMATTVVARGKITKAFREGKPIPADWALDKDGNPTTVAADALKGTLMYIGGAKGSALAMAIDVIAGVLAGASYAQNVKSFHVLEGPTGVGFGFLAIDIAHFMPQEEFSNKMSDYAKTVKGLKKSPGVEEIYMPGEIERKKIEHSRNEGIYIEDKQFEKFKVLLELTGSTLEG